jgi:adenosylcobinamide-phosphate synthase
MVNQPLAAAVGIVADRAFGEPPIRPHPVALLGRGLLGVERVLYADLRAAGVAHAAVGVGFGLGIGTALRSTAAATYLAVAGCALGEAARDIAASLECEDLDRARSLLPALVSRDPAHLDEPQICRAVVESVAENTVDAVVAPALWAAAAGARGAVVHRVVNTMDAMVGYRNARYARYGWAAARLDDAAAWVPARVTAVLVAACRPRLAADVIRTVARDARDHPSPNAGVAEAAFAAALGLRLGGATSYGGRVEQRPEPGTGRRPCRDDIERAVMLSRDVSIAFAALLAAVGVLRSIRGRRRFVDLDACPPQ